MVSLRVDGELWSTHGTLDVYQQGVEVEVSAAQWELTFWPLAGAALAARDRGYGIEVETLDGRRFDGWAVVQHNLGEVWTLLDSGTRLHGLRVADLGGPPSREPSR